MRNAQGVIDNALAAGLRQDTSRRADIPPSCPPHAENFDIFDFSLTADEMNQMRALNKNRRFENW